MTVTPGQSISLVGGNKGFDYIDPDTGLAASVPGGITMTGGKLSAPGGQINIASVASSGEILFPNLQTAPSINGQSFTAMGNINLSQGALLDVSADAAGTVRIRGGQLIIADATISADTGKANGASTAVDLSLTGDLSISDTRGVPVITARATEAGDAGSVNISAANLNATSSFNVIPTPEGIFLPFVLIDTHTSGSGKGGDVTITTIGNLIAAGPSSSMYLIDSGTTGLAGGTGGNVAVSAQNVTLQRASINTGDFVAAARFEDVVGSGGNLSITADTLQVENSALETRSFGARGGDLTLTARDIHIGHDSLLEVTSLEGGSTLKITADKFVVDSTSLEADTAFAQGGGISITAKVVELTNGTTLRSSTFGDGAAGDIRLTATDHLTLSDDPASSGSVIRPSGLFKDSFGVLGSFGSAGSIVVISPSIQITGRARIDTSTESSGHGGDVTITTNKMLSVSGGRLNDVPETHLNIGSVHPSGIYTRTVGNELCAGPCGDAGRISITAGSLNLAAGALTDSGTSSTGRGGYITIHSADGISLSGTLSDSTPAGIFSRTTGSDSSSGAGGNISLNAGQSVTISNGAAISASSTGPGNTGNIQINAGNQFTMTNSTVTTEAASQAAGPSRSRPLPTERCNSLAASSAPRSLTAHGGGGSVNIDPQFVILQNSQILAKAVYGPGGNIKITTNLLLPDSASVIRPLPVWSARDCNDPIAYFSSERQDRSARAEALAADVLTQSTLRGPGRWEYKQLHRGRTR